ncbi:MAG: nitroreductase [Clostridiales bacterium]|nr:nitroreductase [Clostridiales bacterium]
MMMLSEMIHCRKTTRQFEKTALDSADLTKIETFARALTPLLAHIKTDFQIIDSSLVKNMLPWKTPHYIAIFSEEKENFGVNVGFMFQQLDLYVQSLGLGCYWFGLGKLAYRQDIENMKFVVLMGVGHPKNSAIRSTSGFRRKRLEEISDQRDERLEPARLAPSGKNAQPWFFTHEDDVIHCYCKPKGMFSQAASPSQINQIDIGCALAHLYVTNPNTFRFHIFPNPPSKDGCAYIGSFQI